MDKRDEDDAEEWARARTKQRKNSNNSSPGGLNKQNPHAREPSEEVIKAPPNWSKALDTLYYRCVFR